MTSFEDVLNPRVPMDQYLEMVKAIRDVLVDHEKRLKKLEEKT